MVEPVLTPDEIGEIAAFARTHPGVCETMAITTPRELLNAIRVQLEKEDDEDDNTSGS
jgi:hypothetical protein